MAEPEFNVICPNCGSEVSPYVTECPYCGNRLRKRAPDLKKQKKAEEKQERRDAKKRDRLRSVYEGGGSGASWYDSPTGRPIATIVLLAVAIVASVLAASGLSHVSPWMAENLLLFGSLGRNPWALVSAPFLQFWFGYGFVCLGVFALFGAGIERRYGPVAVVLVWLICGALGVLSESLIAPAPLSYGAYAAASGTFLAWTLVVVNREDLRDHDALGIAAIAFVLCALPLATSAASVWSLIGGIVGGLLCGAVLTRLPQR